MGKGKLAKFADMERYENVFQYPFSVADNVPFDMKGHWREMYFKNDNPIVLELGCGKGEYTVGLAKMFPDVNFIGVDIKGARMWTGATQALGEGLKNVAFLRTNIEIIDRFFAEGEVQEIWLTFSDPQMKNPAQASHLYLLHGALPPLPAGRRHDSSEDRLQLPLHIHHIHAAAQQSAAALPHGRSLSYRRPRRTNQRDSRHTDLLREHVDRTRTEHQVHEVRIAARRRAL